MEKLLAIMMAVILAVLFFGQVLQEEKGLVELAEEVAEEELPSGVKELEVTFQSDGLVLAGTLTLPETATAPVAGVLFIAGSGPADRDENAPGLKIDFFKVLAHRLAQEGIGSLRYDKRGVGKSQGSWQKASFTDLVNDARAAVKFLQSRVEIDPNRIFILGHSEGGVIAPILAAEDHATGLITVAGNAHSLDWIILWQIESLLRAYGLPEGRIKEELEKEKQFIEFVKKSEGEWEDYTFEEVKEQLPWVTRQQFESWKLSFSLSWLREHFTRDPLETIRKVRVPTLIIQGNKDVQVPKEEAILLTEELWKAGNEDVELHILADLSHIIRYHPEPADPTSPHRHINEPVDERVLKIIAEWTKLHLMKLEQE